MKALLGEDIGCIVLCNVLTLNQIVSVRVEKITEDPDKQGKVAEILLAVGSSQSYFQGREKHFIQMNETEVMSTMFWAVDGVSQGFCQNEFTMKVSSRRSMTDPNYSILSGTGLLDRLQWTFAQPGWKKRSPSKILSF